MKSLKNKFKEQINHWENYRFLLILKFNLKRKEPKEMIIGVFQEIENIEIKSLKHGLNRTIAKLYIYNDKLSYI